MQIHRMALLIHKIIRIHCLTVLLTISPNLGVQTISVPLANSTVHDECLRYECKLVPEQTETQGSQARQTKWQDLEKILRNQMQSKCSVCMHVYMITCECAINAAKLIAPQNTST